MTANSTGSNPRAKVVLAFAAILASSLTPPGAWWGFAGLLSLILLASWASGLGWGFTLRRSYLALPFALAALPLPFTVAGVPLFVVPGLDWVASVDGTIRLGSVLLRTWTAVQAAILLTATTPFQDLIWALGALGLPRTLVSTIGFMYRYLFVLADEALRMRRAHAAAQRSAPRRNAPAARLAGTRRRRDGRQPVPPRHRARRARVRRDVPLHRVRTLALVAVGVLLGGGFLIGRAVSAWQRTRRVSARPRRGRHLRARHDGRLGRGRGPLQPRRHDGRPDK